jgi:cellulose synthase/poly-beta-1,6-N-acetylglucosamine synthase-like glycosyltransferase
VAVPSVPGRIGVFDFLAVALSVFGLPREASLGCGLVPDHIIYLPAVQIGVYCVSRENLSRRRLTEAAVGLRKSERARKGDAMITVMIPAYNAVSALPACRSALQHQTLAAEGIIVVDEGSLDDTGRLALRQGARVSRQAYQGPAGARHLGITWARGQIVPFPNANCQPSSDGIEEMVRPLADMTVSGVKGVFRTGRR